MDFWHYTGMQSKVNYPNLPAWPFWLADGLLLVWAAVVWGVSEDRHSVAAHSFYILAVLLAFVFGIAPIFLERWRLAGQQQQRLELEFRNQVAVAFGEIFDHLERNTEGSAKAETQVQELPAWLKTDLQSIADQLKALSNTVSSNAVEERLKQIQGEVAELKRVHEEEKKASRRGVNGILYPKKGKASWVEKEEQSEEKGEVVEEPTDVEKEEEFMPVPLEIWVMALIGIGNKPYLRGNLPGLSPDKGMPLDFVEIGKWRWIADVKEWKDGWVAVWLNDEVPAKGNPIAIEQHITEIRPVFS